MLLSTGPADPLYEFGPFVADPVAGRLHCGNDEVPLTPKSFKVLMVLVSSGGQLIDKEQLFHHVWPDTFVEPNNLARNVSMIRKALHERDPDHEYIATISGRGYRFVAPVSRVTRTAFVEQSDSADERATTHHTTPEPPHAERKGLISNHRAGHVSTDRWTVSMRRATTLLLSAGLLASAGALLIGSWSGQEEQFAQRRLWQLTSTGRLDGEPAWSPDGQSIAYSSDRDGAFKIWMQRVRGGTPVRVTSGPDRDWQPSWSPDGRHIAFRSERDGGGLFVVPVTGGGARRIAVFGHQPKWSPDGSRVLFCDGRDLHVVSPDGGHPTAVPDVVLSSRSDRCRVGWHPDGRRVSGYSYEQGQGWVFWTMPVTGGTRVISRLSPGVEQRLRDTDVRLAGFTWAPDGDALYFEGRSERIQNLWRVRVNPKTLEWIGGPDRLTTSAGLESGPAVSPDGTRLAFGSRFERTSVWSFPFDSISGEITGDGHAITPEGANAKILDISPDGTQLVYRVTSRDTDELWIRSLDEQSDRLRKVEFGAEIVHPRWSRDGTQLAYVRRPANRAQTPAVVLLTAHGEREQEVAPAAVHAPEMVYDWGPDRGSLLVRCTAAAPRSAICRLSTASASSRETEMQVFAADADRNLYAAAYSPDGQWVSFIAASDLTRSTIFVSPSAGGSWVAMTSTEDNSFEDLPRWSPDGRTLFFLSNRSGYWNLWGRRFDRASGTPAGDPFQISRFDSTVSMIGPDVSALQIAITHGRLVLPVTQSSGAVWVLEGVDD
jgi:Tol biopolymer transport system component/DNA-binding winged helix-turn-helix (wHTH) protein